MQPEELEALVEEDKAMLFEMLVNANSTLKPLLPLVVKDFLKGEYTKRTFIRQLKAYQALQIRSWLKTYGGGNSLYLKITKFKELKYLPTTWLCDFIQVLAHNNYGDSHLLSEVNK